MNERIDFAMKMGENITRRTAQDCLVGLQALLHGKTVKVGGKPCTIKIYGAPQKRDGEWQFMFDIIKPCMAVDHIEFIIRNTGWGMDL